MITLVQAATAAFYLASVYCANDHCMVGNLKQAFATVEECNKARDTVVRGEKLPQSHEGSKTEPAEYINIVCTEWSGADPSSSQVAGQAFSNHVMKNYGPMATPNMEPGTPAP